DLARGQLPVFQVQQDLAPGRIGQRFEDSGGFAHGCSLANLLISGQVLASDCGLRPSPVAAPSRYDPLVDQARGGRDPLISEVWALSGRALMEHVPVNCL